MAVVDWLIAREAAVNHCNNEGETALMVAAGWAPEATGSGESTIDYCGAYGANGDSGVMGGGSGGSGIHGYGRNGSTNGGINGGGVGGGAFTALVGGLTTRAGVEEGGTTSRLLVELLLSCGASQGARHKYEGHSALHRAAAMGHGAAVGLLVAKCTVSDGENMEQGIGDRG
jgi:hypothetical protein